MKRTIICGLFAAISLGSMGNARAWDHHNHGGGYYHHNYGGGYYPHHRGYGPGAVLGGLALGGLALGGLYALQPRVPYYAVPPPPPGYFAPQMCSRFNGLYGVYESVPCY